jgi:hypothetical protein
VDIEFQSVIPVPFDPRRHLALVSSSPPEPSAARRCLQRMLPDSWRFAQQMAADLARQLEYLPWFGRADTFDTYFLRQAEAMLRPRGLTDLISGERPGGDIAARALDERATRFATWCRAIVSAVLLDLPERVEVGNPQQALTYLLSSELRLAKAGALWTAEHGIAPVERALRELPGYALVLLAASPNDTAERFMARDAFWAAVSKRS